MTLSFLTAGQYVGAAKRESARAYTLKYGDRILEMYPDYRNMEVIDHAWKKWAYYADKKPSKFKFTTRI